MPSVYRVDDVLAALPESTWWPVIYRQGTTGTLTKEFAALRVQCATRSWRGFHHHLALVVLSLTWLNLQRQMIPTEPPVPAPPCDAP